MFTYRILRGKCHLYWTILLYLEQISYACRINLSKGAAVGTEDVLLEFLTEDIWQATPEWQKCCLRRSLFPVCTIRTLTCLFMKWQLCMSWEMASFLPSFSFTLAIFCTVYKHWEWKNIGTSWFFKQQVHWENLKKCIPGFWSELMKSFLCSRGVCLPFVEKPFVMMTFRFKLMNKFLSYCNCRFGKNYFLYW